MNESLLVAGIVCIVASIVGGGVKLLGAEVPVLNSFARQALLFTVGLAFLGGAYVSGRSSAPASSPGTLGPSTPSAEPAVRRSDTPPAARGAACAPKTGLACLPASSRGVMFVDIASAHAAAWSDYQRALSTTGATALATNGGASGKSARLCGIVASDDSSPLGKHLAAVALLGNTADGASTPDCLKAAAAYR